MGTPGVIRIQLVLPVLSAAGIQDVLDLLTDVNTEFLQGRPGHPGLYQSGVRYQQEPPGQEEFCSIPDVMRRGWGDCDDLAPWRAAELRVQGEPARARVWEVRRGLWHCDVIRGDGTIEDPSRILGMR